MTTQNLRHRQAAGELMHPQAVAKHLGVSTRTLQRWCARGHGPKFVRIGEATYFRTADVEAWISALRP